MTALGIIKASGDTIITQTDYGEKYTQLEQRWSINPDFRQIIDKAHLYDSPPQQTTFP